MLTKDAIEHFGGSKPALATALKIKVQSLYDWGEYVPWVRQVQLEEITKGKLIAMPLEMWHALVRRKQKRRERCSI